jgi:capsular exopolysaccharide synthesis family protein
LPSLRRRSTPDTLAAHEEAYRILRSNLEVALFDLELPSVVLTSAQAGEGKTSTCVNLARAMTAAGHRVVLVDLDLRHPDAHRWLGVLNERGVSDVVMRRCSLGDSLQFVRIGASTNGSDEGLYFLPAGTMVPNPAELLSEPRTHALLGMLASQADIVLVDAPPVLPVADSLVVGRMVGGAVLVVETRTTPLAAVQQAKDALTRSRTRLLGIVVNKLHARDARTDQGYAHGYGYPHGPAAGSTYGRQVGDAGGEGIRTSSLMGPPSAAITSEERVLGDELSLPGGTDFPPLGRPPVLFSPRATPPTNATGPSLFTDSADTENGSVGSGNGASTDRGGVPHVHEPQGQRPSQ